MRKLVFLLVFAFTATAVASCGGGSDASEKSADRPGDRFVHIEADPHFKLAFVPTKVSAKAGEVEIEFENRTAEQHVVKLEDSRGKTVGETQTINVLESPTSIEVDLKPGTYTYYCSVPGHRKAGMEGTLTVVR